VLVRRARAGALVLALAVVACSGGRTVRPLRMAVTESGGDFTFSLEEPVRQIACVERDYRRSPTDPGAARTVWTARCARDCLAAVRYADRALESTQPAQPLGPSTPGTCYECVLDGDHGRGITRFRVGERRGFEPCQPRVGDL
jgi:hypothetical protein